MEVLSRVLAFAFACHPHITIQPNFFAEKRGRYCSLSDSCCQGLLIQSQLIDDQLCKCIQYRAVPLETEDVTIFKGCGPNLWKHRISNGLQVRVTVVHHD